MKLLLPVEIFPFFSLLSHLISFSSRPHTTPAPLTPAPLAPTSSSIVQRDEEHFYFI